MGAGGQRSGRGGTTLSAPLSPPEAAVLPPGSTTTHLVLGGIANETLGVRERDVAGRGAVALVVRDNLDAVVLPHADALGRGKGAGGKKGREKVE